MKRKQKIISLVLIAVLIVGVGLFFLINSNEKATDHLIAIKHPEEKIVVTDENSLLQYKADFNYLKPYPVFSISKKSGHQITARYLGFYESLTYASEQGDVIEFSSKEKGYQYFQAYVEVETAKKMNAKEIKFYGKIRGNDKKYPMLEQASTFYSNDIEQGVQHGLVTFKLNNEAVKPNGKEEALFDLYIDWSGKLYSTEKIKASEWVASDDQKN